MYSLRPRELCFCAANGGRRSVKYFIVGKSVKCLSGEVCMYVFFVMCHVCWWWDSVEDVGIVSFGCVFNLSG